MMDLDQGKYFSLNPVATRIWDLLDRPVTVEWLCGKLRLEYDVETGKCTEEVTAYLEEMEQLKLINRIVDSRGI